MIILNIGDDRFIVDDIDPKLCTHLLYSRINFDIERKNIIQDSTFLNAKTGQRKFIELKNKNPQLKSVDFSGTKTRYMECDPIKIDGQ